MTDSNEPFVPRKGNTLQVLVINRYSTNNQDPRSNDDQAAYCKENMEEMYQGQIAFEFIQSQGSGEALDREELYKAEELITSKRFDVVICEDLGRIIRRMQSMMFCEMCEDSDTRLIAINDHIDTKREDWRLNAFFASFKHEMSNKDTSSRIKRTLKNRFLQFGGCIRLPRYGYIRPPGARVDSEVSKDPAAEVVYDEWFRRLEDGAIYTEVADWFNTQGIVGANGKKIMLTGQSVRQITQNTILKGERQRNRVKSKRVNKTGRRKQVRADPEELLRRQCPHLCFIEPERYDRVIRLLKERNKKFFDAQGKIAATRIGIARKKTIFPGQHVKCGICGRLYYWGGNGKIDNMMCKGALKHKCWNGLAINGKHAAYCISVAVLAKIESLPNFDHKFVEMIRTRVAERIDGQQENRRKLQGEIASVNKEIENVTDAVAKFGFSQALSEKLRFLESKRQELHMSLDSMRIEPKPNLIIPPIEQIKAKAREALTTLASESGEYYRLLCRLVPYIHLIPYRLLEGKTLLIRAHMVLDLTPFLGGFDFGCEMQNLTRFRMIVDLHKHPVRESIREQCVELRKKKMSHLQIWQKIGHSISEITKAIKLQKTMDKLGVIEPYTRLSEPPADCTFLRRYRHKRYQFEPLEGFPLSD